MGSSLFMCGDRGRGDSARNIFIENTNIFRHKSSPWMVSTKARIPDLLLERALTTEIFRFLSLGTWKCIGGCEDFRS